MKIREENPSDHYYYSFYGEQRMGDKILGLNVGEGRYCVTKPLIPLELGGKGETSFEDNMLGAGHLWRLLIRERQEVWSINVMTQVDGDV